MAQKDTNNDVRCEQIALLLSHNTNANIANVILASLFMYMLKDVLSQTETFGWMLAILIVSATRFYIGQHFLTHPTKELHLVIKRINIFRLGIFLNASMWGVVPYFVYGDGDIEHQLVVAYMVTGLSAGTAVVYSVELLSASSFLICAVIPMLIGFALAGDSTLTAMCVAGVIYILFIAGSVKTFNQRLIEGILLRFKAIDDAEQIKQLAFYDGLTGLPNRRLLLERLDRLFISSRRTDKRGAILFIDLDHFKLLNDTLGHDMGDELLKQVAARLTESVRESDTVSRFGGDEFVVLLENLSAGYQDAVDETKKITQLILADLNKPYYLGLIEYISTPSIGVAFLGEHGETQDDLLKHADIAMYHAKQQRNTISIYDDEMKTNVGANI
jgi:diguanylate cyclase (GGDEF)-like protein